MYLEILILISCCSRLPPPKERNMAKIIGGIGASHSPTIGFAKDTNKQNDPAWAPIFEGFAEEIGRAHV